MHTKVRKFSKCRGGQCFLMVLHFRYALMKNPTDASLAPLRELQLTVMFKMVAIFKTATKTLSIHQILSMKGM